MNAISLFSCIGVAEYYLHEIGINVVVASDIDSKRCDVHQFLYPEAKTVCGDIRSDEVKNEIIRTVGKKRIDLVISTPPCQGMSSVGKNRSYTALLSQEDERNYLILESFKIIDAVSPSYILFENIPRILKVVLPFEGENLKYSYYFCVVLPCFRVVLTIANIVFLNVSNMIEIKYNTRVYIDKKTNRVMIRARWNGQEVCFALDCRADSTKWDGKAQRPMAGTVHKFDDQNCTARVLTVSIENALDKIKTAFTKCELDGFVPSKEVLRSMVRGEEKGREEVKLKKTLEELYEEFMTVVSDDHNWTEKVHYKYKQAWDQLHECHPDITLETISKSKLRELKNWYVNHGYRNVSVKKQFSFLRTFLRWLQNEGYELQPGVLEYVPNLTVVPKTVTFLKYDELMDFYHYKFPENKKDWDLVRDMFCFMAFTSLRYSDMVNLKKANIMGDHLEICTQKTHDKLSIPITQYAQEIIDKYKDEDYKDGKMFKMYANQIINHLLKEAAKEAGLNREVMQVYYKGSKRYEEVKKFHEVIGCHDGRRTFVCCSLAFGIPPTVVMSCTGHSTYQSMRPYIEVSDETQRTELAKWDQKANEKSTLKGDVAKKLASVDEETLKKVLELLNSQK